MVPESADREVQLAQRVHDAGGGHVVLRHARELEQLLGLGQRAVVRHQNALPFLFLMPKVGTLRSKATSWAAAGVTEFGPPEAIAS